MTTVYKCPYIDDARCPRKDVESLHYYMDDSCSAGPIFYYGCNLPGALRRSDGYPLCRIDVDMLAGNRVDIMKNVVKILSDSKINGSDELEKQINIKEKKQMNNTGNIVGYINYIYQNTRNFRPARFVKEADYEVKEKSVVIEIGKASKLFNTIYESIKSLDYKDVNKLLEDSVAVFKYIQVLETCVVDKKNLDYKAAKEKLLVKDLMKEYGVR